MLSTGAPLLVFDVSTLVGNSAGRPTGADRIVIDVALGLIDAKEPGEVAFAAYDGVWKKYTSVPVDVVRGLARGMVEPIPAVAASEDPHSAGPGRGGGARSVFDRVLRDLPATKRSIGAAAGHAKRAAAQALNVVSAYRADRRQGAQRDQCFARQWTTETVYCSVGLDFAFSDLAVLRARQRERGFRIVLTVHDLIPVFAPQFVTIDKRDFFRELITTCDHLLVISDATREDVVRFARECDVAVPSITKLPLSSSLCSLPRTRPRALPESIVPGSFVLTVGTVTMRKNYQLLFDVWNELMATLGGDAVPALVIAGMRGTLSEETMSRIRREPALQGKVVHLEGAGDHDIAWLYGNCSFTAYPSFCEGWGFPVSESNDFGKVCLTSDRSSLPEAGGGLAVHLDPTDRRSWRDEVMRYWSDHEARRAHEARIEAEHRPVSVAESIRAILGVADSLNGRRGA